MEIALIILFGIIGFVGFIGSCVGAMGIFLAIKEKVPKMIFGSMIWFIPFVVMTFFGVSKCLGVAGMPLLQFAFILAIAVISILLFGVYLLFRDYANKIQEEKAIAKGRAMVSVGKLSNEQLVKMSTSAGKPKEKSAAGAMVKGAVVGGVVAGGAGAVVGAMVGKEMHDSKNKDE